MVGLKVRATVWLFILASAWAFGGDTPAFAYEVTTQKCDPAPAKYDCTQLQYGHTQQFTRVVERRYRGAIDGGADQWRLEYAADYMQESDGNYHLQRQLGPSAWFTNVNLPSYWRVMGGERVYYGNSMVDYLFVFYECVDGGGCFYWNSSHLDMKHWIYLL